MVGFSSEQFEELMGTLRRLATAHEHEVELGNKRLEVMKENLKVLKSQHANIKEINLRNRAKAKKAKS